jgi:hypothetical protein
MGGNAIKKGGVSVCRRIPPASYKIVKTKVLAVFSAHLNCAVVPELRFKEDFGDVDLLYVSDSAVQVENIVTSEFGVTDPELIAKNGHNVSFAVECSFAGLPNVFFQVDLIQTSSPEHLRMASFYYSYGGLGSIIGPHFKRQHLTLSDTGLWCNLLCDAGKARIGRILLTNSPQAACEFAGLNMADWEDGFRATSAEEELDRICAWAASSPMLRSGAFARSNRAHRIRQRKPLYRRMVAVASAEPLGVDGCAEGCDAATAIAHAEATAQDNDTSDSEEAGEATARAVAAQRRALEHFGQAGAAERVREEERRRQARRAKFSGADLVRARDALLPATAGAHTAPPGGGASAAVGPALARFKADCRARFGPPAGVGDSASEAGAWWELFLDGRSREDMLALVGEFAAREAGADGPRPG